MHLRQQSVMHMRKRMVLIRTIGKEIFFHFHVLNSIEQHPLRLQQI